MSLASRYRLMCRSHHGKISTTLRGRYERFRESAARERSAGILKFSVHECDGARGRRQGRECGGKLPGEVFTDHTDVRPTLVSLAGLTDDYSHDGRVVFEVLDRDALPQSLREHEDTLSALAAAYKAINAPLGELGRKSLRIATHVLTSDAATIDALDGRINDLAARRNAIASQMIAMLEAAEFHNTPVDQDAAWGLIEQARDLLGSLH